MELAEIIIDNQVLWATHNYPCPVCLSDYAVYDINKGIFQPCWDCQAHGYRIRKGRKKI